MANRLISPVSFRDALNEQFAGIVIPFQRRLFVARRRARALRPLVDWITKTRLLHGVCILGPVLRSESYAAGEGDGSSGLILQAALLIPRGIGVLMWDSDEVASLECQDRTLESAAWLAHVPFEQCSPVHQALLVDQIIELADQLISRLRQELTVPSHCGS